MSDTLVKVNNVSKKFCRDLKRSMWYGVKDLGSELIGYRHCEDTIELRKDEFWALRDINFQLKRGECLGLIGRNGAGKSTLLKLLNGLIKPDAGRIELHGRLGALIELGAGFNPILSGRENIYINGSVLGFSKREIAKKFEAIVEFSEIEKFIDMPVKNYSSGMKVRLGFAIAVQMKPDILLIDEVLAVGDAGFKIKCYNEIYNIMKNSAVIFVSHSMPSVAKICTRGILLASGSIKCANTDIGLVIEEYYNEFPFFTMQLSGNGKAVISRALINQEKIVDSWSQNNPVILKYNEDLNIDILIDVDPSVKKFNLIYSFVDKEQKIVAQCFSATSSVFFVNNMQKRYQVITKIPFFNLNIGRYSVSLTIREVNEDGNYVGVLADYANLFEIKVKSDIALGAAPIQFGALWNLKCLNKTVDIETSIGFNKSRSSDKSY